ncbi:MAG: hypothetical protein VX589_06095 [Myxococcota bacterium]|nr:hypothetical protein [Myxococcota bacterium]
MIVRLLCLVMFSVLITPALAHTPRGGLAIAVSPDGKTIATGGDNRTLYIVDAATMTVQKRHWLKTTIWGIHFNQAGTKIIVEDTKMNLYLIDATTLVTEKVLAKSGYFTIARQAGLGVSLDGNYKGHTLSVRSLADLSTTKTIEFPKGQKVGAFGLNAKGTQVAVITQAVKDPSETVIRKAPRELTGADKDTFKQKHDGKTALVQVYDIGTGKKLSEAKTFYTTQTGSLVTFIDNTPAFINFSNVNATVSPDGKTTLFRMPHGLNYGWGVSEDGQRIVAGDLARGSLAQVGADVAATIKATKMFNAQKLPGWPEYFKAFAFGPDGSTYGATSGYRIIKIDSTGSIVGETPIY